MTKKEAIRLAESEVSPLVGRADGWTFATLDQDTGLWRECQRGRRFEASAARSAVLLERARKHLGITGRPYDGGSWVKYVYNQTR